MKTVKFYTLGCKVNQYDTQSIRERFSERGYKEIYNGRKADVYLVNTCTVTATADSKSRETIRRCIRENPRARIIVTGCLAEDPGTSLASIRGIDYVLPKRFFPFGISGFSGHTRAFLKVQDGCDNFCSYCKVPLVRGRSRSRPMAEILQEAQRLAENGYKEIVLSGICLGAYGKELKPKIDLVKVIEGLERIDGISRIRLSSIEAGDVSDGLIDKMSKSEKLCRHLHIPIQSGDDQVLKDMNRSYTGQDYLRLIRKIRKKIPMIAITTDCLVGFPSEKEENFRNTLELLRLIKPSRTHIFPYSKRSGTQAALRFKDQVAPTEIKNRIRRLEDIAKKSAASYKKKFVGKTVDVLVEGLFKQGRDLWEGYTDTYIKVLLKSRKADLKNKLVRVKLLAAKEGHILACLADK
jgi:threonylcarbamoyladenosine tRNA methylthiotransferase MtaB